MTSRDNNVVEEKTSLDEVFSGSGMLDEESIQIDEESVEIDEESVQIDEESLQID